MTGDKSNVFCLKWLSFEIKHLGSNICDEESSSSVFKKCFLQLKIVTSL